MTTLVWFRDDLRVHDHPALHEAMQAGEGSHTVALYVLDEVSPGVRSLGGAARWWLHHSLEHLAGELLALGVELLVREGPANRVVREVVEATGSSTVLWNRRYGGSERDIDARLKHELRERGVAAHSFFANLLIEPWHVTTQAGTPYRVYGAFRRALGERLRPDLPLPAPPASSRPASLDALLAKNISVLDREPAWAGGLARRWSPGTAHAHERLRAFLEDGLEGYAEGRDLPASDATSGLSPHLRFGELSPREVWHATHAAAAQQGLDPEKFLSEIIWREFAWHTLYAAPDLATANLNPRYEALGWITASDAQTGPEADLLQAWREGRTGFGLVDAGMRELWATGTMHNRVRMTAASLLTKNLGIDWRVGEAWFWDTLVDADQASNPFNWQWVAGSGADAAPYFRVFNPERQAERFDPDGEYVERWAPDSLLIPPIVDLRESRLAALARYDALP